MLVYNDIDGTTYDDDQDVDNHEACVVLLSSKVKSLVNGRDDLSDTYVVFRKNEAYILNMHIDKYHIGTEPNQREKKLRQR
ncbi:putative SmpB protein [Onchocerca flexuosa]|uniref:Putative SmpB protein n=1 Tax=Onchocerca flexuosa TaxID=387005 RepID=A0A238BSD8_9BILA|nr:putative SmpB protein [Onchocerca flexuosa]